MDKNSLVIKLLELAQKNPALRAELTSLIVSCLKDLGLPGHKEVEDDLSEYSDAEIPTHVPDRAHDAIEAELVPLAHRLLKEGWEPTAIGQHLKTLIRDAFKNKHGLWNTLVYYQSTHENEAEFQKNLESAIEHVVSSLGD